MELPKRFYKEETLRVARQQSSGRPDGYIWLLWANTKNGGSDCVWTVKVSKDSFRFFDTAEAAEAYYALTGMEKKVETFQMNQNYGINVARPRGQGVVKFVI